MNQPIENILAKYFAGEATAEEKTLIDQWKRSNGRLYDSYERTYNAKFFGKKEFRKVSPLIIPKTRTLNTTLILKAAAAFVGLMVLAATMYFYSQTLRVYHVNKTASVERIVLPDGSEVFLDKNASIAYKKDFAGNFHRNVKMTGRVFFHIFRDVSHPFTVHAGILKVKVLGTRFTVNRMTMKTQVVLTHGKVLVSSLKISRAVILQKTGDQVVIENNGREKENNIKAALYSSWMGRKIYFNECTVKEVMDMLNDSYNIKVNIHNPGFLSKKLFGSAPSDDPRLVVDALSQILHTEIEVQ